MITKGLMFVSTKGHIIVRIGMDRPIQNLNLKDMATVQGLNFLSFEKNPRQSLYEWREEMAIEWTLPIHVVSFLISNFGNQPEIWDISALGTWVRLGTTYEPHELRLRSYDYGTERSKKEEVKQAIDGLKRLKQHLDPQDPEAAYSEALEILLSTLIKLGYSDLANIFDKFKSGW